MAFPAGPFSLLESQNHFKGGKLSQRIPWKVGCQLCGFRAGGETEEQKRPRVELQPGKDKGEGQDESRPEKEPVGSRDEEADWELLGIVVDEKVQASKKKKKKWQAVGTVMKTSCTEKETREGDGKLNGKGKRLTRWSSLLDTITS